MRVPKIPYPITWIFSIVLSNSDATLVNLILVPNIPSIKSTTKKAHKKYHKGGG